MPWNAALSRDPDGVVAGTNGGDCITGMNLADYISGFAGNDLIYGRAGNDEISGDDGSDTIYGGAGMDRIVGGSGNDIVSGGSGADVFAYSSVTDSLASVKDTITDFDRADIIDLSAIDAIAGGSDDAFNFIGVARFAGVAGELHYVVTGQGSVRVEGDVNGDAVADFAIEVCGVAQSVTAADYVF